MAKYAAAEMLNEIEQKGFVEERLFPNIDEVAMSIKERIFKTLA